MGYTRVKAVVANPLERSRRQDVELRADTGAIYTMLPKSILTALGIPPTGKRRFRLASGERKEYPTGEAYLEVEGIGVTSLIIFGPRRATPLLGVTTLEMLGFQVDPITGKLKPMELLLL